MRRSNHQRAEIVDRLRRALDSRSEVTLAVLHGSFAQGLPYRDVDVAIWLDPDRVGPDEWFRYALDLSVHLQIALECPVDVRALNNASLAFRYHALAGQPLVVRDEAFFDELRARAWDDYLDFQPFARQYLREALSE